MSWDHLAILIPLSLFIGALLVPLCRRGQRRWPYGVAVVAVAASFLGSAAGLWWTAGAGNVSRYFFGGWVPPIGIELVLDPLSAFFCLLISGIALFVLCHGRTVVERETPGREVPFYSLILLLLGGLSGIVLTGDIFNLYVFLEISSIATYALLAIGDRRAPVAAFRYLILGTVGASFYLLGVGFLFMTTGSLNMADISRILGEIGHPPAALAALVLIVLGLGLKMALFPLHGWLPDAYTHASSTATALVAAIGTKVAGYALIRMIYFMHDGSFVSVELPLAPIITYLGAAGILWGGLMAMAQTDLKRMLAFSSVGHIGYIALGVGLASPIGLIGALLHTLNHAVMKCCLFLVSGSLLARTGNNTIARFDNRLRLAMPWTILAFTVAAVSMIGLPPTAGFFSKWYLVLGAMEQGKWVLIAVIVLSSLFSVVYFFRIIERMYLQPQEAEAADAASAVARDEVPPSMLWPVLVLAGSLIVIGLANFLIVQHILAPMLPEGWERVFNH